MANRWQPPPPQKKHFFLNKKYALIFVVFFFDDWCLCLLKILVCILRYIKCPTFFQSSASMLHKKVILFSLFLHVKSLLVEEYFSFLVQFML
jgi:hypothetical protein